ncbi:MAG: glycoside hydrolase family 97 protein [Marinilabiliaceae bacterium]|nr:glycoside hydrolase family 97 protein [Marinilabiliaceae bacterium]
MKTQLIIFYFLFVTVFVFSQQHEIKSPDSKLQVFLNNDGGKLFYSVKYEDKLMLEDSPLGLLTSIGDYSSALEITSTNENKIEEIYSVDRIKESTSHYEANEFIMTLSNSKKGIIEVVFRISDNDIAYSYRLPMQGETASCVVERELSGFNFPENATSFLSPQATPQIGWKKTKPSYEEEYVPDQALGTPSKYGLGYTFPCLFRIGDYGWILVSETGVDSRYCASHLSDGTKDGIYTVAFPHEDENMGVGNSNPVVSLPAQTPWRTITVGSDLKPIVETTIPFDLVKPLYEPSQVYKYGRSTWSWIMWQDWSMNYNDQVAYIDLAAQMGYEYILMDALWDTQVGYERMPELIRYSQSKGVDVFLWYNSNGYWNNAPQGPKHKMDNSIARKKEMKWLKEMGVKGLKVDFFGGDKQETIRLYEDILSDANEYGLMIIFHGCTLPRGWERMYPNYVGSEAVLASENLIFTQHANDKEAYNACLHPFIRNAVGSMEFGPVLLNKRHNRNNNGGSIRRTSDVFQLATAILFQNPVQMFAIAPNNLKDVPAFEIDFMKNVPTTWDETLFVEGYPGKYCVLARRNDKTWYVVGVNAKNESVKLKVNLPMFAGKEVTIFADNEKQPYSNRVKVRKNGLVELVIESNGGVILTD